MKNLSAIPPLSLFVAFTILITLVVCLAGFTEAEVHSNPDANDQWDEDAPVREMIPLSYQLRRGEEPSNFKNYLRRNTFDKHSDYFGESTYDSDGYGYDDDEYYHFNAKRNDERSENSAQEKATVGQLNKKDQQQSLFGKGAKEAPKETENIEMLNFKESHPAIPGSNPLPEPNPVQKSFFPPDSLNMNDLKENSAIDEKLKDRKDESTGVHGGESKIGEGKKASEEKDSIALKDSKTSSESEKKEKDMSLKEGKDSLVGKALKEQREKGADDKEKLDHVKLKGNIKLDENVEKMTNKAKITKEGKDSAKINAEGINPKDISQMNNRASLVSNDYKDSIDPFKMAAEENEKIQEDMNDKNLLMNDYQEGIQGNDRDNDRCNNYDFMNSDDSSMETTPEQTKNYFALPVAFETQEDNPASEYYRKRESWREHEKARREQQQLQRQQQMQVQRQQQMQVQRQQQEEKEREDQQRKLQGDFYRMNFPPKDLENTEYHKTFIKSLKRYKGLDDNSRVLTHDSGTYGQSQQGSLKEKREGKKKRSRPASDSKEEEKDLNRKSRRQAYSTGPELNSRNVRKSPSKLEYEIKIINQNQQGAKNVPLLRRRRKDSRTKLADHSDEKYQKKYRYSQVSRDDLLKLKEVIPEKKFKRKAPQWSDGGKTKRESLIRTRGVPSGYYGNRVKFGQKHADRGEEKQGGDTAFEESRTPFASHGGHSAAFDSSQLTSGDKHFLQRSMDDKAHDPMKRYDSSEAKEQVSNSLLLLKKGKNGDKIAKVFGDVNTKESQKEEIDSDQLARLLSKNNDYLILKKTENNKFQKISDPSSRVAFSSSSEGKKTGIFDASSENMKGISKQASKDRDVDVRSSKLVDSTANLKKQVDKLQDLADFLGDQDSSSANQRSPHSKDGNGMVFSDGGQGATPMVFSNEGDTAKMKPQNSIFAISNNFKQMDQGKSQGKSGPDKNFFMSGTNSESTLEPALRNAFPEAKSINSMSKNGNEIIVLDFNSNQLKTNKMSHGNALEKIPGNLAVPGDRQIQLVLKDGALPTFIENSRLQDKSGNLYPGGREQIASGETQAQIKIPLNQLAQLPNFLKALGEKKSLAGSSKIVGRENTNLYARGEVSQNFKQFLRDFQELSEIMRDGAEKKGKFASKRDADVGLKKEANREGWYADPKEQRSRWTSKEDKTKLSLLEEDPEYFPEEMQQEIQTLLHGEGMRGAEKDYQDELREELSAASDRIQRLRREGMSNTNLQKKIEDALSFRERRQSETSKSEKPAGEPESKAKATAEKAGKGENAAAVAAEAKTAKETGLQVEPQLKDSHAGKDAEKSQSKSDNESAYLGSLAASENEKQQQLINTNESEARARKRRHVNRKKRSLRRDVKNNVSRTALQNKILKKLAEDNYQSVYSPGITRKLLSTEEDAKDAVDYYKPDELDAKPNCVKNSINKCVDPTILELFDSAHEKTNRARRSLTTAFHSNYKREIDLDESMPNDFQNFLVTSLGGFGSQKREVIKKDEALWEGREASQENYNQIADAREGRDPVEDSGLEKREVSAKDDRKRDNYMEEPSEMDKKTRSPEKAAPKMAAGYDEDKIPTHIRIQITNASNKEKKSSKPIMEESETTSTEMETLPKEKEFFDKNKLNSLRMSPPQKLHSFPKSKYSYALDFADGDNAEDTGGQRFYFVSRPFRRSRRKKKKYVQENPIKPVKDFIAFDQKAMEILMKKYFADQNLYGATTQKIPVSNHLPQVETVYNPTQGTNKAQIDPSRFGKENIFNKNTVVAKTSFRANEASADECSPEGYFKGKVTKVKMDKGNAKELEDMDWKPYGKMKMTQDSGKGGLRGFNNRKYMQEGSNTRLANSPQKWCQTSGNGYSSSANINAIFEGLQMKQDLKAPPKDPPNANYWPISYSFENVNQPKTEEKEKASNQGSNNAYEAQEVTPNKKPYHLKYRQNFGKGLKFPVDSRKMAFSPMKKGKPLKSLEETKQSFPDLTQTRMPDSAKDADYMDAGGDDYYMDYVVPKFDNALTGEKNSFEKENIVMMPMYKNMDGDDVPCDEDDEFGDDYDESAEDDQDDYSLITMSGMPEMSRPSLAHGGESYKDMISPSALYPKAERLGTSEMKNRFSPDSKQAAFAKAKQDSDAYASSMNVLKRANGNSNLFGKNLMKSLNRYNYDDAWKEKKYEDAQDPANPRARLMKRKMPRQQKLKRSRERPQIGSHLFYATKTEMNLPASDMTSHFSGRSRTARNVWKRSDDDLRDGENESEENEADDEDYEGDAATRDSVLENVIGKTIMRKSIAPSAPKAFQDPAEIPATHDVRKRAADDPGKKKILKKRLFTGHLAETNFRKFHKKTSSLKRHAGQEPDEQEGGTDAKRSALGIFKKLTNKVKDDNKMISEYTQRAGFEPLVSLTDKKYETPAKNNKAKLTGSKKEEVSLESEGSIGEKKKEKSKEELGGIPALKGPGPWRLELVQKPEAKISGQGRGSSLGGTEAKGNSEDNLKAYLVIRKNAVKRESRPPLFGAPQREVGKENPGKRIRERSAGVEPPEEGSGTETSGAPQSILNRALRETKSHLPHVRQRNASFVKTEDQFRNSGGKPSSKRRVFPPSNDANIIGDSSRLNEETSRYLGEQIVDAILTHVSENPNFKQFIAPGLALKTPCCPQEGEDRGRTLGNPNFSDQVQTLLEKVMMDLERLAERQVKRRMCSKIDEKSKKFLHSLLELSGKKADDHFPSEECLKSQLWKNSEEFVEATTFAPLTSDTVALNFKEEMFGNLNKKRKLLQKLLSDYQHLSLLEKQALDVNYRYLQHELDATNRLLQPTTSEAPAPQPQLPPDSNVTRISEIQPRQEPGLDLKKAKGLKTDDTSYVHLGSWSNHPKKATPEPFPLLPYTSKNRGEFQPVSTGAHASPTTRPVFTPIYFEPSEEESQRQNALINRMHSPTTTPDTSFESVQDTTKANKAQTGKKPEGETNSQAKGEAGAHPKPSGVCLANATEKKIDSHPVKLDPIKPPIPSPERFDLLPFKATPKQVESTPANTESVRIKQSLPRGTKSSPKVQNASPKAYKPTELHKLGIGDAAGLQLSLKSRGPWVSNLDLAKTVPKADFPGNAGPKPQNLRGAPLRPSSSGRSRSMIAFKSHPYEVSGQTRTYSEASHRPGHSRRKRKKRLLGRRVRRKGPPDWDWDSGDDDAADIRKDSDVEDPALEYLIWSSMPAVRRRLNNLEMGVELSKVQFDSPSKRFSEREKKQAENPRAPFPE